MKEFTLLPFMGVSPPGEHPANGREAGGRSEFDPVIGNQIVDRRDKLIHFGALLHRNCESGTSRERLIVAMCR